MMAADSLALPVHLVNANQCRPWLSHIRRALPCGTRYHIGRACATRYAGVLPRIRRAFGRHPRLRRRCRATNAAGRTCQGRQRRGKGRQIKKVRPLCRPQLQSRGVRTAAQLMLVRRDKARTCRSIRDASHRTHWTYGEPSPGRRSDRGSWTRLAEEPDWAELRYRFHQAMAV